MTRINRWWTVISGASRFINDIVDAVTEGGSVIVKNSADIPFCDDLVGILSSRIGSEMHDRAIKMFDSSLIQEDTVEKYLCEHYCPDEFFIPSKGFTRTHFLVRSKVFEMNNSIRIIKKSNDKSEQEWIRFIGDYSRLLSMEDRSDKAQFILFAETDRNIPKAKQCSVIDFLEYVTEYDYYVFCLLSVPDSFHKSMKMKQYLAEITSELCRKDTFLIYDLLEAPEELYTNTYRYYNQFVLEKVSENEINKILWKSQIKLVFPILEEYRCFLVEKYRSDLESKLPFEVPYGESITEPENLELGHILFLNKELDFLKKNELEKLRLYKTVRNNIAHMRPASPDSIEGILSDK